MFDISDQDGIADWMREEFPGMRYILAKALPGRDRREGTYRGMYLTGDESLTSRAWVDANVRSRGPLGALYPVKTWTAPNQHGCLKEGDTPSWFFFLPLGGNDPNDPTRARLGRPVPASARRLVPRPARHGRIRSAHDRQPLAAGLPGRLRTTHGVVSGVKPCPTRRTTVILFTPTFPWHKTQRPTNLPQTPRPHEPMRFG